MGWLIAFGAGVVWAMMVMMGMMLVAVLAASFNLPRRVREVGWRSALKPYALGLAVSIVGLVIGFVYVSFVDNLTYGWSHCLMVAVGFGVGVGLGAKALLALGIPIPLPPID